MTDFMADWHGQRCVALVLLILAGAARAATGRSSTIRAPGTRAPVRERSPLVPGRHRCAHLAVGAAGDAGVLSLALPLIVADAAVLLRSAGEPAEARRSRRAQPPARAAKPAAEPRPAPTGSNWGGDRKRRRGAKGHCGVA